MYRTHASVARREKAVAENGMAVSVSKVDAVEDPEFSDVMRTCFLLCCSTSSQYGTKHTQKQKILFEIHVKTSKLNRIVGFLNLLEIDSSTTTVPNVVHSQLSIPKHLDYRYCHGRIRHHGSLRKSTQQVPIFSRRFGPLGARQCGAWAHSTITYTINNNQCMLQKVSHLKQ